jgi:hypothetical protein
VKLEGDFRLKLYVHPTAQHPALDFVQNMVGLIAQFLLVKTEDGMFVRAQQTSLAGNTTVTVGGVGVACQQIVVVGLDTTHDVRDVAEIIKVIEPESEFAPKPKHFDRLLMRVARWVWRFDGGAGQKVLKIPRAHYDAMTNLKAMMNQHQFVKYGQSKVMFFSADAVGTDTDGASSVISTSTANTKLGTSVFENRPLDRFRALATSAQMH